MGYMRHHAIVVTSWSDDRLVNVHRGVIEIGQRHGDERGSARTCDVLVSPIVGGLVNGRQSFLVAPDGSKEGWGDSDAGDQFREEVVRYLRSWAYDDGSTSIEWCEVQFGDDNKDNRMLADDAHPRESRMSANTPPLREWSEDEMRNFARVSRAGMWLESTLGTSFVCRCGWRSGIDPDFREIDERLARHVMEAHDD